MGGMWPSRWATESSPSSALPLRMRITPTERSMPRCACRRRSRRYADQRRLTGGLPIQVRVGVNTGEVVVRAIRTDDLHTDYVPIGHSTGLAARMQALATPGSILVTGESFRLTEGYFA